MTTAASNTGKNIFKMKWNEKYTDETIILAYRYESADGIKSETSGIQKLVGPKAEDIGTVSKGSYSYTSPEGIVITVNWTADENGFRATGDHLPVAPATPPHVVKLLADLKAAGVL